MSNQQNKENDFEVPHFEILAYPLINNTIHRANKLAKSVK